MTDLLPELWTGLFLPLAIAVINQDKWAKPLRAIVAVLICVLAATLIAWLDHKLDLKNWSVSVLAVLASAVGFYKALWEPSSIAPRIERATSA